MIIYDVSLESWLIKEQYTSNYFKTKFLIKIWLVLITIYIVMSTTYTY